jgi:O-antigen biosynthesis protein
MAGDRLAPHTILFGINVSGIVKMKRPVCSLIVVNYNGLGHLKSCFEALQNLVYPRSQLDLIMVDNGSQDGSIDVVRKTFPTVRTFVNTENNFAKALNLGVTQAKGQYIGFLHNDVTVEPQWLNGLVKLLDEQSSAGGAAGKILFKNGRVNSVGYRQRLDFYFEDIGFNEEDRGQYNAISEVEWLCWVAVLFRRECLQDVGPVDEDFVMYLEDVDFAARCRARGWQLLYTPLAVAYHDFQESSRGTNISYYFCSRNRFLYLAKHVPSALPQSVTTSHFFIKHQYNLIFDCMPMTIKKLILHNEVRTVQRILPKMWETLISIYGPEAIDRLFARMQVILGHRKMSLGIYDHALHLIGGGQKYVCTMASILQDQFDITYIANKDVDRDDLEAWYSLDISKCYLKIMKLPFYEERNVDAIDPALATQEVLNPFEPISQESSRYDVFIIANTNEKVKPLAPICIFICCFPDRFRDAYFTVDDYTLIISISNYTNAWMKERWDLAPFGVLYPPVDMGGPKAKKEKLILSVARFEIGGSKKQKELIRAFHMLLKRNSHLLDEWRLLLVGGSLPNNPYLKEVRALAETYAGRIEVRVNVPATELQALYAKATIFWHACGLNETEPHLIEHFGMTTVEAMQNYCVPVVINGGGQREIVEEGKSGFLFNTLDELCQYTLQLITDPDLLRKLREGAYEQSQCFTRARFQEKVKQLFDIIQREYSTIHLPEPKRVAENLVTGSEDE